MHNIDRTLQEFESGVASNNEYENYETSGGYGQELGQEFEYEEEMGQEFEEEFSNEFSGEYKGETYEMSQEEELVGELLEVTNEQELNQFLGNLVSRVAGAASQLAKSPAGQSVGRYLVDFGKKTLPQLAGQYGGQRGAAGGQAGAALGGRLGPLGAKAGQWAGNKAGGYVGKAAGSWVGTQAGNLLADNAKKVFGLELEALNPESQELEIARSYVRFASDVARRSNRALRRNPRLRPGALGRQVLTASAPYYAPGLLNGGLQLSGPSRRARCGQWERRDGVVVLYGL